jgi:hypothetical protein
MSGVLNIEAAFFQKGRVNGSAFFFSLTPGCDPLRRAALLLYFFGGGIAADAGEASALPVRFAVETSPRLFIPATLKEERTRSFYPSAAPRHCLRLFSNCGALNAP